MTTPAIGTVQTDFDPVLKDQVRAMLVEALPGVTWATEFPNYELPDMANWVGVINTLMRLRVIWDWDWYAETRTRWGLRIRLEVGREGAPPDVPIGHCWPINIKAGGPAEGWLHLAMYLQNVKTYVLQGPYP